MLAKYNEKAKKMWILDITDNSYYFIIDKNIILNKARAREADFCP